MMDISASRILAQSPCPPCGLLKQSVSFDPSQFFAKCIQNLIRQRMPAEKNSLQKAGAMSRAVHSTKNESTIEAITAAIKSAM